MAVNILILQGYMVKDVKIYRTRTGQRVAHGTIAVERNYIGSSDGRRPADFIDFVGWNVVADNLQKYFPKGKSCIFEGGIEQNTYEDVNGKKRRKIVMRVDRCYFGDRKNRDAADNPEKDPERYVPTFADLLRDGGEDEATWDE